MSILFSDGTTLICYTSTPTTYPTSSTFYSCMTIQHITSNITAIIPTSTTDKPTPLSTNITPTPTPTDKFRSKIQIEQFFGIDVVKVACREGINIVCQRRRGGWVGGWVGGLEGGWVRGYIRRNQRICMRK